MTLLEYCVALFPGEAIFSQREGRLTIETRRLCELEDEGRFASLPLKAAFPYLDLMIGITDWDESPPVRPGRLFRRGRGGRRRQGGDALGGLSRLSGPHRLRHLAP